MFVFFDRVTRAVQHIVTLHPIDYADWLRDNWPQSEDWLETDEAYRLEEIEVLPDKTLRRRQPMTLTYPQTVTTGVEFAIGGVPAGVSIIVNGAALGVMDDSGVLEFTAQTGGAYRFRFEGPGYITQEISLEARS